VQAPVLARRTHATGLVFALLDPTWRGPLQHAPPRPSPLVQPPPAEVLRPWVLPFVFERETAGQGLFDTDLRPVVALFLRFGAKKARPVHKTGDKLGEDLPRRPS
jgi:hypothetical protein